MLRSRISDDIGMEMSDVFEDFDPVPVGCASLAQVGGGGGGGGGWWGE